MNGDGAPVRRTATILLTAMGLGSLAVAAVLVFLGADLQIDARVGSIIIAAGLVLTGVGVIAALRLWSHSRTESASPQRFLSRVLIAAALTEAGFLAAVIGSIISNSTAVVAAVAVVWVATVLGLLSATRTVELGPE